MEGLKRYNMIPNAGWSREEECDTGRWVKFEDLEAKIKELSDFYEDQIKRKAE